MVPCATSSKEVKEGLGRDGVWSPASGPRGTLLAAVEDEGEAMRGKRRKEALCVIVPCGVMQWRCKSS